MANEKKTRKPTGATSASALAQATGSSRRQSRGKQAGREREATRRAKQSSTADDSGRGRADVTRESRHDRAPERKGLAHRLYVGETSYDFIRNRRKWYLVSAVLLLICIVSLAVRGLNLGIEFKGGTTFTVPTQVSDATINTLGTVVTDTGLPDLEGTSVVTIGQNTARVQTRSLSPAEVVTVRSALAKEVGTSADQVAYSTVGASWGDQITQKGLQALIVFLVLVGLMIWAYFRDWKMSVAALVALLHDLILTVGVYSLTGFVVSPATLIGVLTILGYSLYDTVVVFDKVRENVRNIEKQDHTFAEQTNLAINQVLVRSINTTIIGVLPVAALLIAAVFFMGPGPLEDLGLAMFVGMIAGAYSSIFLAAPLLAQLREREPAMVAHRERLGKRTARHARGSARSAAQANTAEASADEVSPDEAPSEATRRRRGQVVLNPVGEPVDDVVPDNPWELEGVEVDDEDGAQDDSVTAGARPQPRDHAAKTTTARSSSQRRSGGRGASRRRRP